MEESGIKKDNLEKIGEAIENISEAWNANDFGALLKHLMELAGEVGKISPELAPLILPLAQAYGSAVKPITDELAKVAGNGIGYGYEKAAEIYTEISPQMEKYEGAKASHYARKIKILMKVKFTRREAMEILLTEMAKSKQGMEKFSKNLPPLKKKEE